MLQTADVVFLIALVASQAQAEPDGALNGNQSYATEIGPPKRFVAIAEIGPPPRDVGDALDDWDRIKRSNDVSELEAIIARDKTTFLAKLARHRIEQLDSQRIHRPNVTPARLTPSN